MTARINDNVMKGIFFTILFAILLLQCLVSTAQTYKGLSVSFGNRTQKITSTIPDLHGSKLVQSGGEVGFVYGNDLVRARVGLLGYYTSSAATAGTTDLYTSNIAFNVFPLSALLKKSLVVEPYLTAGLDYDQQKFYGFYLHEEPGMVNYSQAEAPFLGKVKQVNMTGGVGIQVRLKEGYDFIHLFGEIRYGRNLKTSTSYAAFSETRMSNPTHMSFGVRFGSIR